MTLLRWTAIRFLALITLALPSAVLGDGKVFSRAAAVIEIPDQEALIHHAAGVQTMVIETRFKPPAAASGASVLAAADQRSDFAWVVPVPGPKSDGGRGSVPDVFPATTGIFPTLRAITAPHVEDNVPAFWALACIVTLVAIAIVGLAKSQGVPVVVRLVVMVLLVLIVIGIMLPSLGKARSSARAMVGDGVDVLSRSIVGSYDVAVVGAADDAAAEPLIDWLAADGHHIPPEAKPVIADYTARGWVFVAAKLRMDTGESAGPLTPHPLGMRFKSREAVYPVRLTAVGGHPLKLDLYVFADQQAAAPGMDVARCGTIARLPTISDGPYVNHRRIPRLYGGASIPIAHEGLLELIGEARHVTKLSGVLTTADMSNDLSISWRPAANVGAGKYSRAAAVSYGLNVTTGLWFGAVLLCGAVAAVAKWENAKALRALWLSLVPCVCGGVVAYAMLPTVRVEHGRARSTWMSWRVPEMVASEFAGKPATLDEAKTLFAARVEAAAMHKFDAERRMHIPRLEDSPFNYTIRESSEPGRFDVFSFDAIGQQSLIGTIGGAD